MRAVVTGAAGFVGSSIVDALLERGDHVVGVDMFSPYYDPQQKRANLSRALTNREFTLVELDLRVGDLRPLLRGSDVVFHQAAQPGVRLSWSEHFSEYTTNNVIATQRLLEASARVNVGRVIYASSSSIYGNAARYPTVEAELPRPHSPYGVTKLAGEHLCALYTANLGLPTVSLRYFTVYGPRQRPDMAIQRLIECAQRRRPFSLYGDGTQRRDFTYVRDVVGANLRAASGDLEPGTVVNIAGGRTVAMNEVVDLVGALAGRRVHVEHLEPQHGDVYETGGSIDRARELLGWEPQTSLESGLEAQLKWNSSRMDR